MRGMSRKRVRAAATGVVGGAAVAALALAGAAAGATARAGAAPVPAACATAAGVEVREVGPYVVTLRVGTIPRMYTVAQARAVKPKSGVVMLEPMKDLAGGGMMGGGGRRLIRVQVCDRATGKALRSPRPTVDIAASMLRQSFPLTLGYDVGTPPTDVRFCQVVVLPNEPLGVAVHVGRWIASFSVAPSAP